MRAISILSPSFVFTFQVIILFCNKSKNSVYRVLTGASHFNRGISFLRITLSFSILFILSVSQFDKSMEYIHVIKLSHPLPFALLASLSIMSFAIGWLAITFS